MDSTRKFLFKGTVAAAATKYIGVPVENPGGVIGAQVAWLDATSSGTITLEFTNYGADEAPVEAAGSAWEWEDSGETFSSPAASAAGSTLIQIENARVRRARIKYVAAADSSLEVLGVGVA